MTLAGTKSGPLYSISKEEKSMVCTTRIVGVKEYVPEPSKTLQEWMEEREVSGLCIIHVYVCCGVEVPYIYSVIATTQLLLYAPAN